MSFALGFLVSLPLLKMIRGIVPMRFTLYLSALGMYHWLEYLYVSLYHYSILDFDSKSIFNILTTFRFPNKSELGLRCGHLCLFFRELH